MQDRKIRIDRILSIVIIVVFASTTIMYGIKLLSGKSYKVIPTNTYIIKSTTTIESEKVYISSLLTKKVETNHLSAAKKELLEKQRNELLEASKKEKTLSKLQEIRKKFELSLYDAQASKKALDMKGLTVENGVHEILGHVIVNKKYALPESYNPKESPEAKNAFLKMILAMQSEQLPINSSYIGYFDFSAQEIRYSEMFYDKNSKDTDKEIARAGHSEHQTGLSYKVLNRSGKPLGSNQEDSKSIEWIKKHARTYGFIIRYPEGKEKITGFKYTPSLVRYVGVDVAKKIAEGNLTFEEYFKIEGGEYRE